MDPRYDLTVTPPRPGDLEAGGWVWLPRMIDKARATYHGNPSTFAHPCGRDRGLLAQMGISVEEFKAVIDTTTSDEEVVERIAALRAEKGL